MSDLVIVESPAKAKTIKKYLGKNFDVVASVGHIRDLPKSQLGVDIEHNFEPQYENKREKSALIKELKAEAKKADTVYLATDPDREGEAISWHLAHVLDLDGTKPIRVTFSEITKTGIQNGMSSPRSIDMDLVNAQQARRILDRIVGYKLSPFLWKKVRRGLSAGRVQSVAVRLIVDRENEIKAFESQEYWTVDAKLHGSAAAGQEDLVRQVFFQVIHEIAVQRHILRRDLHDMLRRKGDLSTLHKPVSDQVLLLKLPENTVFVSIKKPLRGKAPGESECLVDPDPQPLAGKQLGNEIPFQFTEGLVLRKAGTGKPDLHSGEIIGRGDAVHFQLAHQARRAAGRAVFRKYFRK